MAKLVAKVPVSILHHPDKEKISSSCSVLFPAGCTTCRVFCAYYLIVYLAAICVVVYQYEDHTKFELKRMYVFFGKHLLYFSRIWIVVRRAQILHTILQDFMRCHGGSDRNTELDLFPISGPHMDVIGFSRQHTTTLNR